MLRRFRTLLLALALCISCIGSAAAVSTRDKADAGQEPATKLELATGYADELKELGLFKGTENGYELERTATRAQALTMLLRIMGLEPFAQAMPTEHPFTDLPPWCDRLVGFAYRSELVNGVTPTTFAPDAPVNARAYLTFLLRALDFGPADGLSWDTTYDFARRVDLIAPGEYTDDSEFLRADLVILSHRALEEKPKTSLRPLLEQVTAHPTFPPLDNGFVNTACLSDGYRGGDGTFPGQLAAIPQGAPDRPTWEGTETLDEMLAELNVLIPSYYEGLTLTADGIDSKVLRLAEGQEGMVGATVFSWRQSYSSTDDTNRLMNAALEVLRYLTGDGEVAYALWSWIDASNIREEGADSNDFGFVDGEITPAGPLVTLKDVDIVVDTSVPGQITYWFASPADAQPDGETEAE